MTDTNRNEGSSSVHTVTIFLNEETDVIARVESFYRGFPHVLEFKGWATLGLLSEKAINDKLTVFL